MLVGAVIAWTMVCGRTANPFPHAHSTRKPFLLTWVGEEDTTFFHFSHSHAETVVFSPHTQVLGFSSRRELGELPYPHNFPMCKYHFWILLCSHSAGFIGLGIRIHLHAKSLLCLISFPIGLCLSRFF